MGDWGLQFTCGHCGQDVRRRTGEPARNHCPYCLWSQHTEIGAQFGYPPCGELMKPTEVGNEEIVWRCLSCAFMMRAPTDDYIWRTLNRALGAAARVTVFEREDEAQ
jgi:RNHCP domain